MAEGIRGPDFKTMMEGLISENSHDKKLGIDVFKMLKKIFDSLAKIIKKIFNVISRCCRAMDAELNVGVYIIGVWREITKKNEKMNNINMEFLQTLAEATLLMDANPPLFRKAEQVLEKAEKILRNMDEIKREIKQDFAIAIIAIPEKNEIEREALQEFSIEILSKEDKDYSLMILRLKEEIPILKQEFMRSDFSSIIFSRDRVRDYYDLK